MRGAQDSRLVGLGSRAVVVVDEGLYMIGEIIRINRQSTAIMFRYWLMSVLSVAIEWANCHDDELTDGPGL